MIDRIAASNRPPGANSGTQSWRSLLFCHWEVPVDALRQQVPKAFEIDTFDGRAFVGIVPFKMRAIRPNWLPRAMAMDFLETNVRTYVICNGHPGVYFFSLDASSRLAVWAARAGWALPYHFARMSVDESSPNVIYQSRRPGGAGVRTVFRPDSELGPSNPGTLEHFLLERYLLMVERRGTAYIGQVHHAPYHAFSAVVLEMDDELVEAAGLPVFNSPPQHAHFAEGVDVEVFGIRPADQWIAGRMS